MTSFEDKILASVKIRAEEVMSTPLFLLSPEDSLWTAHQEMLRRHVQRLVVSWDWGKGLGIVTQTNLLRIFDPMEMYGVIETLQHTVQKLDVEEVENSSSNKEKKLGQIFNTEIFSHRYRLTKIQKLLKR